MNNYDLIFNEMYPINITINTTSITDKISYSDYLYMERRFNEIVKDKLEEVIYNHFIDEVVDELINDYKVMKDDKGLNYYFL